MFGLRAAILAGVVAIALTGRPVAAQDNSAASPGRYETQLRGLTALESVELVSKLSDAQDALRRGEPLYFELLSGAPASYPMTATSPRDAFLSADFNQPFEVERLPPANPSWKPYRLTLLPNGLGNLLWDVEVVLGFYGDIARVEMVYRPPHPF
jgi:hypothetical protein